MPDAAPLEPGDPRSLGQYEVVGRLGAGGQGAVYLGRTPAGEHVAIKLLHAQMAADPAARARFAREVAAAQKVEPFCTARVYEADVQGNQPYIVSEFIDGPSLHDVVAHNGPRGAAELERLAIGTVTALAAIHEVGIVHRDFKPNNVLLAADGPRVVDFGIARTVNSQESAVTATGMVVGTPGYLAPEQLTGAPLQPAVDIFAWGATMVFAATGQSPFEAETLPVIINRILNDEPDLSALQGPLRDLVGRCLAKDPAVRPPAPQLLLQLLGHVGAAPASPAPAREELLGQGTRIAAQLPPPPPVPHAPPSTPPPQPITPPPAPAHAMHQGPPAPPGPVTPPPQPITPPPMPVGMPQGPYAQGPVTPPPLHQPMAPQQPMYAPPQRGQGGGSNGPLIAGVGCAVALVLAIVVVIIIVAAAGNGNDDDGGYSGPTYSPYTYTPPSPSSSVGSTTRLPSNFDGTWRGTGYQTSSGKVSTWTAQYSLLGGYTTGRVTYSGGSSCTGVMLIQPGATTYKASYRVSILTGNCIPVYVTFYYITATTLRFEERAADQGIDSTAVASGTLSKV